MKKEKTSKCTMEMAMYRLDCANHFISLADTKNSIGLAATTIAVSILSSKGLENLIQFTKTKEINWLSVSSFIILGVTIIFLITSILFYAKSLIPKNDSTDTQKVKLSSTKIKLNTFYYRHISMLQKKVFMDAALSQTEEESIKEILEEAYYNSDICTKKMKNFKYGIIFSLVSILLSILFMGLTMFL